MINRKIPFLWRGILLALNPLIMQKPQKASFTPPNPRPFWPRTGLVSKELHSEALSDLMHLRYTTSRETIYKGIFRVLPGEMLTVKDGVIVSRSHQDALPKGPPEKIGFDEAMARLDTVLTPSRFTLEAMSPMACTFQVGGVDSSVFLSLMHQEVGAGIRTFTVGFPGTQVHDERASHGRQPMSQRSSAPCIAYSEDFFGQRPRK